MDPKHLPDLPESWSAVTIEHLLTHTAGIPNYTAFPTYMASSVNPVTIEQLVAVFRDKPLDFAPGSDMRYSNSGYATLGMLIEKISGASYGQFVRNNIFVPLGMSDSGYDSHSEVIARRASGYAPGPSKPVNAPYLDMSVPHAAGALYSTTHDLLKWARALHGGKLLSPASLAKMTTPARDNYAFGLTVVNTGGRRVIHHGGGINGFSSFLAYYPDSAITVMVLSNVAVGPVAQSLARDLAALAHGETVTLQSERKEITLPAGTLDDYVGTYALGAGGTMTVRLDGAQLTAQLAGQQQFPLFAESETKFFLKAVDAQIEFVRGDDKVVSHLVLHQNGNSTKGARTASVPAAPAARASVVVTPDVLAKYAGVYELRPGFDLTVAVANNTLTAQATGQSAFPLAAESPTRFYFEPASITLEFVSDAAGVVTHMLFQQGPVKTEARRR